MPKFTGYGGKTDLIARFATGRNVLHLGAVGETNSDTEVRIGRAHESLHSHLTKVTKSCVGVDYDEASVTALTDRGIFSNLLLADVTKLKRADIPLDTIDLVVAGDTIEHLSNPGDLLDTMSGLVDPTSQVVITTPNALSLMSFLRNIRGQSLEGTDHVCSFNQFSLVNLLHRHGWRMDDLWACYQDMAARNGGIGFKAGKVVFNSQPRLGGTLLAVCSRC